MTEQERLQVLANKMLAAHVGGTVKSLGTEPAGSPTNNWGQDRFKYRVDIRRAGQSMWLHFYTGTAWTRPPTIVEVMDNLLSDAAIVENDDYDDVQASPATRRALDRQTASLKRVLDEDYETILWHANDEEKD